MMDWSKHPAGVVQHSVNVPGVNASHGVSQKQLQQVHEDAVRYSR
jgi:hypothetical protein